ncbi:MAG TPA: DUF4142 domain-containing protein [Bacteroidales bacterium]|nr:DUF4142 domain-containing protein [Bacteroidales bacterium]
MKKILFLASGLLMISAVGFSQVNADPAKQTKTQDEKSATQDKTKVQDKSHTTTSQSTGTGAGASQSGTGTGSAGAVVENRRGKDLEFLNEAASGGLMEVQLGKLAQQKASSQLVKDFGKMMERDHSDANTKLRAATSKLGVPVSSSIMKEHQDKIEDVSDKTGKDFDKAYIDLMVKDHKDDVDKFEKAADNLEDPTLKQWASSTLPVLKKHLAEAQKIQDQIK